MLLAATPASAEERIQRFVSDVQIQKDSSLEVTETIDVHALILGRAITGLSAF